MKAVRVVIHNFRSILDADVELEEYALAVGANNAGKSNLFAAIRAFYEKDKDLKFEESRDFPKCPTADKESWVEVEYACTDDEFSQLKEEYRLPANRFRVRKYFQSTELDDEGKKRTGIYAYENGRLSGARFYGAKNVQQGKLGTIIYIPAATKLDEHTKLSGPSALRELLNSVLKDVIASSPSYKALASAFGEFGSKVRNEEAHPGWSLAAIEDTISQELAAWDLQFQLGVNPLSPEDIVKSLIDHQIVDGALRTALSSSAFGQGFQRHLVFVLVRLAGSYSAPAPRSAKKEFSPSLTWLLFEEPEAFLHPTQMMLLDSHLRSYAADAARQVTISTHSPQFASRSVEAIPALLRLNRDGPSTVVSQISRAKLPSFLEANQAFVDELRAVGVDTTSEDATVAMESVKYALWLNPLRSQLFFAERVLLVEGATEYALFSFLLSNGTLRMPQRGIAIIDTMGKWNTHRFMNILSEMRIPHSVLIDGDGGTAKSVALAKAIDDSRTQFTLAVSSFPHDLESFLGAPKSKRQDRKPQSLMWHVTEGKVPPEAIAKLAEFVQPLLDA